nr:hypothetical protein [Elizabethkingia sp. ASV34]
MSRAEFTISSFGIYITDTISETNYKTADIYTEDDHQVPVEVKISFSENLEKKWKIPTEDELREKIYLCYKNGEPLTYKKSNDKNKVDIFYTGKKGKNTVLVNPRDKEQKDDFFLVDMALIDREIEVTKAIDDKTFVLKYYIQVNRKNISAIEISAGIKGENNNLLSTSNIKPKGYMANGNKWEPKDNITIYPVEKNAEMLLRRFNIYIEQNNKLGRETAIFNNKLHQAKIVIVLEFSHNLDKVKKKEIENSVFLCDYKTGKQLSNDDYIITKEESLYNVPYSRGLDIGFLEQKAELPVKNNTSLVITRYVSGVNFEKKGTNIAASIKIDSKTVSSSAKNTSNNLNVKPFKNHEWVTLIGLERVDYSKAESIELKEDKKTGLLGHMWKKFEDFTFTASREMLVQNHMVLTPSDKNGISSWVGCKIIPRNPNLKFKNIKRLTEDTHSIPGVKVAGGGADIIWSVSGNNNYDASFIFVNRKEYGLKKGSEIKTKHHHEYEFVIKDDEHWWGNKDLKDDEIRIDFCNYRIPEGSLRAHGWGDQPSDKTVRLEVKDQYGNTGVVSIVANPDKERDDKVWPRLHINGNLL